MTDLSSRKKKKETHPTRSFDEMVSDTTLKRLKPLVQQEVSLAFQHAAAAVTQYVLNESAQTKTRQLAFERLLKRHAHWFSEEALALEVAAVEDESAGYTPTEEPAQAGDRVFIKMWVKREGAEKWNFENGTRLAIHSLGTKNPAGDVQTDEALEASVVGLKAGETKDFVLTEEDGAKQVMVEVQRVSRKQGASK